MIWYWVSLSYATFGIASERGCVVKTAPIGEWMLHKSMRYIYNWIILKKGEIKSLTEEIN